MLNLDTRVLIYAFQGRLTRAEKKLLSGDSWSISGIVLWEIAKLQQLGRIEIDLDDQEIIRAIAGSKRGRSRWTSAERSGNWIFPEIQPTSSSPRRTSFTSCL